ncbi:uncharacterized protein LOC106774437 isoform X3 [Vigna radiata var. radiata]|uniref:Uncharacterized protein LOC106774437 isoform X3 n=1 Tax=Vigna radiata var. radiata TaxID=3916 RepID=A0A3Q0FIM8_VIGRR|nr:uncharacterized protein LOC106774437 isoform X3 [Vigna radiata var. radiata]
MTSSLSTKRQRSGKQRREKALAIEPALPTRRLPSIEEVLNQTRFFGEHDHMIQYGKAFYKRKILTPKIMNFPFFAQSAHLKYQGQQLSFPTIPDDLPYNRDMAFSDMIRPELQGQNVKTVGAMNVNDRLLHYVLVHILSPRATNFAKIMHEDTFMLWAMKNNILINWPHHIMQHMIKCKDNKMPLPYGILITQIMGYYGVDLTIDSSTVLGWTHYFGTRSLKKLNIVNVNGVWHHGGANEDEEHQPEEEDIEHEETSVPDHHVEDSKPQPLIQHDAQMLSQIWGGIQHLQEGLANLNLTVTRGFDRVTERINSLEERFDTFQDSFK